MGALLWKRRVREDLRTFVPTKSIQIPLSSHFSERGLVHQKKWKVSGGVIGLLNDELSGIELAKAGSSHLVNVGVLASLFVVISLLTGQVASIRCHVGAHSDARGRKLDRR
jgi:hypothetical protein